MMNASGQQGLLHSKLAGLTLLCSRLNA